MRYLLTRQILPERTIPGLLFFAVLLVLWQTAPSVVGEVTKTAFEEKEKAPRVTRVLAFASTDRETGGEVTLWQNFLVDEKKGPAAADLASAFESGSSSGYFGAHTEEATREWQEAEKFSAPTGVVEPQALLVLGGK